MFKGWTGDGRPTRRVVPALAVLVALLVGSSDGVIDSGANGVDGEVGDVREAAR